MHQLFVQDIKFDHGDVFYGFSEKYFADIEAQMREGRQAIDSIQDPITGKFYYYLSGDSDRDFRLEQIGDLENPEDLEF